MILSWNKVISGGGNPDSHGQTQVYGFVWNIDVWYVLLENGPSL